MIILLISSKTVGIIQEYLNSEVLMVYGQNTGHVVGNHGRHKDVSLDFIKENVFLIIIYKSSSIHKYIHKYIHIFTNSYIH